MAFDLNEILKVALKGGASDIHLKAGLPPMFRVDGMLVPLKNGERVFKERRSILFKTLQVVRFYDAERRSLIYLGYSDKIITGSPQNTVSAVPLRPWNGEQAEPPTME